LTSTDRASGFKLLFELGRVFFAEALLDFLRGAVDEVLGFLEAQARGVLHDLDDGDLLAAGFLQDDVVGGGLGVFGGGSAGGRGGSERHRGGSGHAELLFKGLHELAELEHGKLRDAVDDGIEFIRHGICNLRQFMCCCLLNLGGRKARAYN
jgi:hypothetical protein